MKITLSLNEMREMSSIEIEKIFWEGLSKSRQEIILSNPNLDLDSLIDEYFEAAEKSPTEDDEQFICFDDFLDLKVELLNLKRDNAFIQDNLLR